MKFWASSEKGLGVGGPCPKYSFSEKWFVFKVPKQLLYFRMIKNISNITALTNPLHLTFLQAPDHEAGPAYMLDLCLYICASEINSSPMIG